MRIFRATYRDESKEKHKTVKWYIDFFDHNRIRHRIPAFSDKRISEALGRNIESLVNCRISGLEPDKNLNHWLETIPANLMKKFVSWGLMEGQRAEISKTLREHISDYIETLKAKGFSNDYVVRTKNRLKKITVDCRFCYFRDITKSAVEIYSGKLKRDGFSDTSRGHYLDSLKTFLNWAEQDQRISHNPLAKLEKPARDSVKKGILRPEEFVNLIKTTFEKNILIGNTTGQERAILYAIAGTTGIRRKELLNLTWDDINLTEDSAFVRVKASIAKNGKEARQPVPPIVVNVLMALKGHIKPKDSDRVFMSFGRWINTAGLIRNDLTAAGIPLKDKDGNEICFHSLRNSYISFLANADIPPKVVQKLARHSDPRLTFNTYARVFNEAEQNAVNCLPNFGGFHFANSFAKLSGKPINGRTSANYKNHVNDRKMPFLVDSTIPPRGVEPLLPG